LVRVRTERWRVVYCLAYDRCAVVELSGADQSNRGVTSRFLLPFEQADLLPPHDERPRVVTPAALRHVARRALGEAAASWSSLRSAARARIDLLPFQLEPAVAMMRGLSCRFLLADEVGLGKTIQAGLMASELLTREPDARVLIVTPAGLREQWREELRERFDIAADVIDATGLARAVARLSSGVNPWVIPRVAIASIDFLKRADVIRALEPLSWDLVIFDEAHALGGRSDRATAARLIAARGRRVVLLTATPHSGDEDAFERLCALGRLPGDGPLLLFRRSRAGCGVPGVRRMHLLRVRPTRAERRMHDALAAYARAVWRDAPPVTSAAARLAMNVLARRACSSAASFARSLERRMALLEGSASDTPPWQLRLPLDDGGIGDDEAPDLELGGAGLTDARAERRWLERLLAMARDASAAESKVCALARLLRRIEEPAIVFTEYRDTLERLATALAARKGPPYDTEGPHDDYTDPGSYGPLSIARIHGGMTAAERTAEARRFTHGDATLLLATDAASEGLNLHRRCRVVINLEIPWTPLRLEQRIGRVDRLGQSRPVHAVNLVARDTTEEDVLARLAGRQAAVASGRLPDEVRVIDLREDARSEAARLAELRAIRESGSGTREPQGPVFAVLRQRARARRIYWAFRLIFTDDVGNVVWEAVRGADAPVGAGCESVGAGCESVRAGLPGLSEVEGSRLVTTRCALRQWIDALHQEHAAPLALAAIRVHTEELARLRDVLGPPTDLLIAREQSILNNLRLTEARLASPLLQPGLFDRRAARLADAQARVAEAAATRAHDRISALRRLADACEGDRHLIFAVALPGRLPSTSLRPGKPAPTQKMVGAGFSWLTGTDR
jgi:superfamily II DNA or RNA helicase